MFGPSPQPPSRSRTLLNYLGVSRASPTTHTSSGATTAAVALQRPAQLAEYDANSTKDDDDFVIVHGDEDGGLGSTVSDAIDHHKQTEEEKRKAIAR